MKRVLSKVVVLMLVLAMLFSLAACGKDTTPEKQAAEKPAKVEKDQSESNDKSDDKDPVKVTLWHQWTAAGDKGKVAFDGVLEAANDAFPNIDLEVDEIENEIYKTKIKTAIASNEAPDIFYTWGAGFAKPFVDSGKVLALDEYLNDGTRDKLLTGVLEHLTYDGKVYALPRSMWVGTFYCNTELFDKLNVEIPETYAQMLEAVKIFRANDVTPMAVGEKDRWPGMFYYNILALRTGGAELNDQALRKQASYDSPEFIDAAAKLQELVEAEAFDKGCLGLTRDEAEAEFMRGNTAMYFNHSYPVARFEADTSGVKGKLVAIRFPMVEGGKGTKNELLGGANDGFAVSSQSEVKDEAVQIVKYVCENSAEAVYVAGSALPAWKTDVDPSKLNPLFKQIADIAAEGTDYIISWDTFLEGADADVHKNLVQEIFAGVTSPEKFAKDHQKINE